MLATLPEETAKLVAEDIGITGRGYVCFDREGRARHVPSCHVLDPAPNRDAGDRRMRE